MLGKKRETFVSKRLVLTNPSGSHHYLCASTVLVSKPLLSDWARIRIERASCGLRKAPILSLVHNTHGISELGKTFVFMANNVLILN